MMSAFRQVGRSLGLGKLAYRFLFAPWHRLLRLRLPDRPCLLTAEGFQIEVFSPRHNRIGEALYQTGIWEPQVTQAVRSIIRPGMTVVDVGADIGYFTLLFASLAKPGTVVAFEPIPSAHQMCKGNLERNGIANVMMLDCALGRETRTVILREPLNLSRIDLHSVGRSPGDIEVSLRRFDDLWAELALPRVDAVKIDVEGAEHEVLLGMEGTLRRDRPLLIVEVHGGMLPLFASSKAAVLTYLEGLGYRRQVLDGDAELAEGNTTYLFEPVESGGVRS